MLGTSIRRLGDLLREEGTAVLHDAVSPWIQAEVSFGICLLVFKINLLWSPYATRLDVQENDLRPKLHLRCRSPASSTPMYLVPSKAVPIAGAAAGADPRVRASDCSVEIHLSTRSPCAPAA